jgi:hypothetical protein
VARLAGVSLALRAGVSRVSRWRLAGVSHHIRMASAWHPHSIRSKLFSLCFQAVTLGVTEYA